MLSDMAAQNLLGLWLVSDFAIKKETPYDSLLVPSC